MSLEEAKRLDHGAIAEYGLSEEALIDSASSLAYSLVRDELKGKRVLFMIGPGNNGSDGLGMASLAMLDGIDFAVCYPYKDRCSESNRKRRSASFRIAEPISIPDFDIIIDALFGFSFEDRGDPGFSALCQSINSSGKRVISLDVPSGIRIRADRTIAFTTLKDVFYVPSQRGLFGVIDAVNPGFPEEAIRKARSSFSVLTFNDLCLPSIPIDGYKNTRGHVAVIGGSRPFQGAPRLSARAAFASGAGLVTLISDDDTLRTASLSDPSLILSGYDADLSKYSSIVIGPGWGEGYREVFERAYESNKRLLIDADALKYAPGHDFHGNAVLTPHIGEFRRLCALMDVPCLLDSPSSILETLRRVSGMLSAIVVLKSSVTWICFGSDAYVFDGANPSLGVAGSGDVLAGIIGALLGQEEDCLKAAMNGVILHQKAGLEANRKHGFYMAERLIEEAGRAR